MAKEIFIVRNRITLQGAILDCSEHQKDLSTAIHFQKFILLLVKLQCDCSEVRLYTKMAPPRMFSWKSSAWTVRKQLSTAIHFRKFPQKIPVVESFFWSNCRLAVQSSDYILK